MGNNHLPQGAKNETIVFEIQEFELRYDGLFHITWFEDQKEHKWFIFLLISDLLRMVELEGLSMNDVLRAEFHGEPIKFEKVVLQCTKENSMYNAWGFVDRFLESTLEKDGYCVELPSGDSLKNHKNKCILGEIYLKDKPA
jgi:hypothetical protein